LKSIFLNKNVETLMVIDLQTIEDH